MPQMISSAQKVTDQDLKNGIYEDHLKFAELSMHSQSKQGETHSPQTIYYTNVSDNGGSPVLPTGGPMNSSWPMSCHDLQHTSQSPYSTTSNHGAEIWRFSCGMVDCGPVIAKDGTIYFGDKTYPTCLYALNPNGTMKWRYQLADIWVWSTPAIAEDGAIYVGDFEGNFYAVDSNGSLRWRYRIPGPGGNSIASSPAVAPDGTIYFGVAMGDGSGYIYALNPDGSVKWRYLTSWIFSDPAIGPDGVIYIGSSDHYLYAMNPNGTLKWRFLTGDWVKSHPSIASDGTIYFTAFDNTMYALNPDGTLKWSFGYGGSGTSVVPIASDGTLYIVGDVIYALYPNGTVRWRFAFMSDEYVDHSSPAISADGTIYVGTSLGEGDGGYIVAVNPNGTERWRKLIATYVCRSSPAVASDGTVYIGSSSIDSSPYGFLHAFGRGPLKVDIGGPYKGMPNVPVQFHCNVVGGEAPYSYLWSFGDGSTSATKNPTYTYTQTGLYNVTLLVTDNGENSSSDSTTAFIDNPPNTPVITGSASGLIRHSYIYNFVTTDPENDAIEYWVEWGDGGNTGWLGPHQSGEAINLSYTWMEQGTYTIKCKARDSQGWESGWGTLKVTMPLSYDPPHFRFLEWLLERFQNAFPILRHLFK
jgi:outer membrane protein assembly factor BamB